MPTVRWIALVLVMLLAAPAAASAQPIPDPLGTTLAKYQGAPATAQQLSHTRVPQNPFMAPNPRSNITTTPG